MARRSSTKNPARTRVPSQPGRGLWLTAWSGRYEIGTGRHFLTVWWRGRTSGFEFEVTAASFSALSQMLEAAARARVRVSYESLREVKTAEIPLVRG